ncbi:MAG: endonuclease VII domain-containing protein [Planctomycetota bacterium]|jgi:hypothetical protein
MLQVGFLPVSTDAKLCGICLKVRYRNGQRRGRWEPSPACRSCTVKKNAPPYRSEMTRPERARTRNLARFGLTNENYEAMWSAQNGRCAACGRPEAECGKYRLAVDHDHRCCPGKRSCGRCVRGLLCAACNTALGLLGDDPRRIANLQAYATERSEVAT